MITGDISIECGMDKDILLSLLATARMAGRIIEVTGVVGPFDQLHRSIKGDYRIYYRITHLDSSFWVNLSDIDGELYQYVDGCVRTSRRDKMIGEVLNG